MLDSQVVKESDWAPLESKASKIFKEKQTFERLHVSLADLKEMFGYSKYKMYYIENLLPPEGSTVYRCGTLGVIPCSFIYKSQFILTFLVSRSLCWSTHTEYREGQGFQDNEGTLSYHIMCSRLSPANRTLLVIFVETTTMTRWYDETYSV